MQDPLLPAMRRFQAQPATSYHNQQTTTEAQRLRLQSPRVSHPSRSPWHGSTPAGNYPVRAAGAGVPGFRARNYDFPRMYNMDPNSSAARDTPADQNNMFWTSIPRPLATHLRAQFKPEHFTQNARMNLHVLLGLPRKSPQSCPGKTTRQHNSTQRRSETRPNTTTTQQTKTRQRNPALNSAEKCPNATQNVQWV